MISGLASLAGFPVSIAVAELGLRYGQRVIVATCITSVLVCLGLAATAGGPTLVVLPLLVLVQITSIADAGALSSGAVAAADPARRGTALAAYAFTGYTAAFVGPVAVGIALDQFGGAGAPRLDCGVCRHGFGLDRGRMGDAGCPPLIDQTRVVAGIRVSPRPSFDGEIGRHRETPMARKARNSKAGENTTETFPLIDKLGSISAIAS